MRALLTATMAGSALAIGLSMVPAQSLPLGGKIASPDATVQQVRDERGHREGRRDRDRRRDGSFYFGFGPGGPSFGYGRQPRGYYDGYRGRGYYDGYGYRDRGYYDGYRGRRDF